MENKTRIADVSLLLVALLWGAGFIAVQYAIEAGMPSSLILATRFMIGAVSVFTLRWRSILKINRQELKTGLIAGMILFFGFFMQTYGQSISGVSSSAFLTAVYVVIVPFIIWLIKKHPPKLKMFILVFTTLAGVIILTYEPGSSLFTFHTGDIFLLLCALGFAVHVVYLGLKAKDFDPVNITFLQLGVSAVLGTVTFFATDASALTRVDWSVGLPAVVYLGVFSSALCYFLQTWAQTMTAPSKAAIIMSAESLFGPLIAIVIGMEAFRMNILIGGVMILGSVVLSEINLRKRTAPVKQ